MTGTGGEGTRVTGRHARRPDIHLSEQLHNHLTVLTRRTKITHRNALLRWAFCRSLAEQGKVPPAGYPDSGRPPIAWETFAGDFGDVLWGLLRMRCHADGVPLDEDTLAAQFLLHLHRGAGYLVADPRLTDATGVAGLVQIALDLGDEAEQEQAHADGRLL